VTFRSPKLLRSAEGQACVICGSVGTTIAAHANSVALGKGTGIKSPDYFTAWVCQFHHDLIDGRQGKLTREQRRELWEEAFILTVAEWFKHGIVIVK
jgi:hypothetical protein